MTLIHLRQLTCPNIPRQVFKCEHSGPKGKTAVAVKLARTDTLKASDKEDIKREASCMMYCSHPNVVRILGVCFRQTPWLMVLEYCREGSLKSLLRVRGWCAAVAAVPADAGWRWLLSPSASPSDYFTAILPPSLW